MIKLMTSNGDPMWLNPARVEIVGENPKGGAFVYFPGDDARIAVTKPPDEVARLIAEAQRPAAGVDLEAVAMARRILNAIEDACFEADRKNEAGSESYAYEVIVRIDRLLGLGDEALWEESAAALRALAARLGGAS